MTASYEISKAKARTTAGPSTSVAAATFAQDDIPILLAAVVGEGGGEGFFGLGADAEVGVGFGEEDFAVFGDDVSGGDGETPAWFAVDEGDVDEDGLVVGCGGTRGWCRRGRIVRRAGCRGRRGRGRAGRAGRP